MTAAQSEMPPPPILVLGAASITILMWGATPAVTEYAIGEVDAALVGMLRTLLAAPLLLLLIPITKVRRPRGTRQWSLAGIAAFGGFIGFTILFSLGLARTSTAHAALIIAAAPITTGLVGFAVSRNWPRALWWIGAGIAFLGEFVLIFGGVTASADGGNLASLSGDLLCVAATIIVATGYIAGGKLSADIGSWSTMTWSVLLAGIVLLPFALPPILGGGAFASLTTGGVLSLAFLAICTSVIGYALWYWALDKGGVSRVAPVQFAQAPVSLFIAVAVLSEPLSLTVLVATALVLLGVALARRA